tara:strand:+ start:5145 stop:7280 length:2136 start_codon:yes stop_codon:yes gene_type:complete
MNLKLKKQLITLSFAICSFLLAAAFLGFENLKFNEINWLLGTSDISNAQNGWTFFKNDKWHFPLGKNPNYGLDISTSIIFSDSIPLLAFIFKLFKNLLSDNFQYFSFWIFLCFFLQFYLSYIIIYKLTNSIYYSLISSIFFIISPIFIYRLGIQMSLGGHWLILLAFYINFFIEENRKLKFWIFLLILSILIHLYFTAMLFVIYISFLLESFLITKKIKKFIFDLFFPLIIVLFFMLIFGYFETSVVSTVGRGYGALGLDLLGIFDPQVDASNSNWSLFLNNISGTSLEGFSYFGLGIYILLFSAFSLYIFNLYKKKVELKKTFSNHIGYLLIIVFLSLWAITTNIHLEGKQIFSLPLHNYIFGMLSIFAATGRFIWPVYYLLIILSLFYISKNLNKKFASIVLTIILSIQIADSIPGLTSYFVEKKHTSKPKLLSDEIWSKIPNEYEKFRTTYLFNNYGPIFLKLNHFLGSSKIKKTDIVLVAGMDRSKAALARYNFNKSILNKTLPNDTAYVIDNLGHLKQMKFFLKNTEVGFFYRDQVWLALPNKKNEMLAKDRKNLSKIKFSEININEVYKFNFKEREELLGVGWSHNNESEGGVWSEGDISFILFRIKDTKKKELKLELNIKPYNSNKDKNFDVKIFLNNNLKKEVKLINLKENERIIIDLENDDIKDENVIMFKFNNLISPLEIFESPDARKLGILLKSMKFKIE